MSSTATTKGSSSLRWKSPPNPNPSKAVAGKRQALDVPAVPGPQLEFEEVAPVGDQGAVGLLLEEIVRRSRRLAQPASRNGSLLGSKRDRKIAASIGSSKQ
jgi:hypothetical protein